MRALDPVLRAIDMEWKTLTSSFIKDVNDSLSGYSVVPEDNELVDSGFGDLEPSRDCSVAFIKCRISAVTVSKGF